MATLSVNISGVKLDRDNGETALETTKGPLHRPQIEVGPLTAKIGRYFHLRSEIIICLAAAAIALACR